MRNPQYVRIVGNVVTYEEIITHTQITLEDLMAELEKQQAFMSDCLPPGCRYLKQEANFCTYVIEQPPAVRSVRFKCGTSMTGDPAHEKYGREHGRNPVSEWRLSLPYVVFVFRFNKNASNTICDVRAFYRVAPLSETDNTLLMCNLPNVGRDGIICIGDHRSDVRKPITERIAAYISEFWQAEFNTDLKENFNLTAQIVPEVKTLTAWQEATAANPLAALGIPWKKGEPRYGHPVSTAALLGIREAPPIVGLGDPYAADAEER